jgi:methyl-accepting chemotaxis protein
VAEGDLTKTISFRKRDFLQEISADGNLAVDYLRQEIGDMQQISEKLVNHLEGVGETGMQAELQMNAIEEAREIRDRLGNFKIEKDQKSED